VNIVSPSRKRVTGASDGVLVQEAAAGSGTAFAALYDRYEQQVFNYCLRLLGTADDAADATQEAFVGVLRRLQIDDSPVLDFAAYLFTAARNESYAAMRRRDRSRPTEEVPEEPGRIAAVESDPERAALLRDVQEEVRTANARLAPRHREVLALREVAGRSYDEIGAILGISANAAAQLLWRARAKLRDELRLGAVSSVSASTEECERAQTLIGMREDGEALDPVDERWLDEHLDDCGSCRASRAMLLEVGASYRSWVPVAALVGLRETVIARAGEVMGADWAAIGAATEGGKAGSGAGAAAAAGGVATIAAVGIALGVLGGDDQEKRAARALPTPASPPVARDAGREPAAPSKPAKRAARAARASVPRAAPPGARTARPGELAAGPAPEDEPPLPPERRAPAVVETSPAPPDAPATPALPAPRAAPEPVAEPPPPCTHPSGAPAGCPPGQGGTPPGQGGIPPGLGALPPGRGGPPPR